MTLLPWDNHVQTMRGLPTNEGLLTYTFQELELGHSKRGYFGIWLNLGAHGEIFWHGSKN